MIGFVISVGILLMIQFLDRRIKSESDLKRIADLPVLGSVSEFSEYRKDGFTYGYTMPQGENDQE